jgi:hypothetical protein
MAGKRGRCCLGKGSLLNLRFRRKKSARKHDTEHVTQVAFSEFWGFLGGVLCAVEGVCNLAVFPTVTLDYILELSGLR